ncbi:unnamed protein product, partial [Heterosigma akashiwo]
ARRREKEDLEERQAKLAEQQARRELRRLQLEERQQGQGGAASERGAEERGAPVSGEGPDALLPPPPPPPAAGAAPKSCTTCGGSFATPAEHRAHFRSDWHRYNLKLKLKGGAPVPEAEFLAFDAEELLTMDNYDG